MRTPFEVVTCDKCGADKRVTSPQQVADWGKISLCEFNGKIILGTHHQQSNDLVSPRDLCPSCTELLVAWWNAIVPIFDPRTDAVDTTGR